jgi:hypothetical protein
VEAYIVLAMDVDRSTNFSLTRFNSFISGESVSVNRKFKTAISVAWKAAVAMASNSNPPFDDVAGNCARRFFIILFTQTITKTDATLFKTCRAQLGTIMVKMVLCYLHALRKHASGSLWDCKELPPEIKAAKQEYLSACSPLAGFMTSEYVDTEDSSSECSVREFERNFNKWIRFCGYNVNRNRGAMKISAATDSPLLKAYNCNIVVNNDANMITGCKLLPIPSSFSTREPTSENDAASSLHSRSSRSSRSSPVSSGSSSSSSSSSSSPAGLPSFGRNTH